MFLLLHNFIVRLPSVEQVERIFKVVRFILWNLLELVLLITAMIAIGGEALSHVPGFRVWLNQPPLTAPAPPSLVVLLITRRHRPKRPVRGSSRNIIGESQSVVQSFASPSNEGPENCQS